MPNNKTPRRKHKPKNQYTPMMTPTRNTLALSLHMAVDNLITCPSPNTCNDVTKKLAVMTCAIDMKSSTAIAARQDPNAVAVKLMAKTLTSIIDRYARVGKVGISDDEADVLRKTAGSLDRALGTIPANVFKAAAVHVALYDATREK